jgi:hypothetical protein
VKELHAAQVRSSARLPDARELDAAQDVFPAGLPAPGETMRELQGPDAAQEPDALRRATQALAGLWAGLPARDEWSHAVRAQDA